MAEKKKSDDTISQGASANINGANYEDIVYAIFYRKIELNYTIKNILYCSGKIRQFEIYDKLSDEYVATFTSQTYFNSHYLKDMDIRPDILGFEKQPDGLLCFSDNTYILLEFKDQNSNGSVSEKLGLGPVLRDMYREILNNTAVEVTYILDDYFRNDEYRWYINRMDIDKIQHFFGYEFPLDKVGLHETIKLGNDEIEQIKKTFNKKKISSDKDKIVDDGESFF